MFLYLLYRGLIALVTVLPLGLLFRLGQWCGLIAWLVLPRYRQLALHNVTIAFGGEQSQRELRQLVRRHFQRLGANLFSGLKVGVMPLNELERCAQVENLHAIERHLRDKRGVVLVLSHLGNWELISQFLPKFIGFTRNSTVYQKLGNRRIDEHVRRLRARAGVEMFDRSEGFHKPIELLRSGGAIGILSDQHAGDQGLWVPFFGRLASTTPLPALLAKRTGAALVSVALYTESRGRWRIVIEPGIDSRTQSIEELTARTNELIAAQVRRAPEDWFWVHNRWKTPRPNFLLARYKRGVYLPPSATLKPFRILIRASNWLGDACMSIPAVRAIKRGRPDAHVTIATPAKLAPAWRLVSEVDSVVELGSKSPTLAAAALRRAGPFDAAVLFPNSLRSAVEIWLAGIPRRVGYRGHSRSWLLNQIVRDRRRPGPPEHHSARFLRIAYDLGASVEQPATSQIAPAELEPEDDELLCAICPGAEYGPAKRWLPERFAEAARSVADQTKARWILFGTGKDAEVGRQIAEAIGDDCVNRIGQTTLDQLIGELRRCRLLLTNDTGTMHLAALLGIPTVSIFGSTEPALTGPLGQNHTVLRHHVECSPCFLRDCPIDFRCMHAVPAAEARDAVMSILRAYDKVSR